MKRCPNCQKVFDDDKKFCQIDGTPLVAMVEEPNDPFKTVVGTQPPATSSNISDDNMKTFVIGKDERDDLLQIPEAFDPMKTMVVSEPIKPPPPTPPPPTPPINEPVVPAPPKFSEPSLNPPSFGDLSPSEPPKVESPFSTPISEPPKVEPPKMDAPVANPFNPPPPLVVEPPKFEATPLPSESSANDSPFNPPPKPPIASPFDAPPPIFNEPKMQEAPKPIGSPFDAPASPFDKPATPFGQANDPFANQQQDSAWSPPPAPVQSWQDQSVGQNTPFQPPPAGTGGQNKTLPIVSLVCGILGFCCGILGIVAIITGFMGRNNANTNPQEYGGAGLATAGMILGIIGFLLNVALGILQVFLR